MTPRLVFCSALLFAVVLSPASVGAHPLDPSLLQLIEGSEGRVSVEWRTPAAAPGGVVLRPRLPASCSPLEARETRLSDDGKRLVVTWRVDCGTTGLAAAEIAIEGLAAAGTDALLRIERPDGGVLQAVLRPSAPTFTVAERPSTAAVATDYTVLGFEHILAGPDHLLFVLGLLLLIDGRRRLLLTITAFTAGHSITLALSVLGHLRVEPVLAETLIAASILMLAIELVTSSSQRPGLTRRSPWLVAGGFGLVHGLGFAGALAEIGLPRENLPLALASFNVGIELGQVAFVVVIVALFQALRSLPEHGWFLQQRFAHRAVAYPIGVLATFWLLDRISGLA